MLLVILNTVVLILTVFSCLRLRYANKRWSLGLLPVIIGMMLALFIIIITGTLSASVAISLDLMATAALLWIVVVSKPIRYRVVPRKKVNK